MTGEEIAVGLVKASREEMLEYLMDKFEVSKEIAEKIHDFGEYFYLEEYPDGY